MVASMTDKQWMQQIKKRINDELRRFFGEQVSKASSQHRLSRRLMKVVGEFTLRQGAKRIRGTLVVLGFLSNPDKRVDKNIIRIAAAYELLHAYLLIHDDIIDEDVERRGHATLHKLFIKLAPQNMPKTVRKKIGIDIAIIAGDLAADLVQRLVLDTTFSDKQKLDALEYLEQTLHTTYVGQVLDILSVPQATPPIAAQKLRYLLKTATYSIEAPFMVGARLAKAKFNAVRFKKFADSAGLGFQLGDDLLNVFGQGLAGRSSDIRHGKVTLLISLALKSNIHRADILQLLIKKSRNQTDLIELRKLLRVSGGLARANLLVAKQYSQAEKMLSSINLPIKIKIILTTLIDQFKSRK